VDATPYELGKETGMTVFSSVRIKLILPSLVSLLSFILVVVSVWMPAELEQAQTEFEHNQRKILQAMEADIVRNVLAHDYAALYASIDQQMERLKGTWLHLQLFDAQRAKRLYPLSLLDSSGPPAAAADLIELEYTIQLDGERFVSIDLVADWSTSRRLSVDSVMRLSMYLISAFAIFAILGYLYQNRIFRRPLLQLTRGAGQIASGNFEVSLPPPGSDEMGDLVRSFMLMRDNLRGSQEGLRRAIQKSMNREAFQRSVFRSMAEGLITVNRQGLIMNANPAAENIFGYVEGDLNGANVYDLMPLDVVGQHQHYLHDGFSSDVVVPNIMGRVRKVMGKRADGREVPLEITVTRMQSDGEPIYNALMRDITEREQAESALLEAKRRAEMANEAKSRFLATMSHEIRTPMNGVLGMLQLLQTSRLDAKQQEFVDTAASSGELLLTVINDILDYSKMESGQLRLESIPFDPVSLVEDSVSLLAKSAFDKGIELICFADPGLPGLVRGDPMRLRQILTNLTNNAIKFTERGEVLLYVRQGVDALCFGVRDTGIGMTGEQQEKLFQSFSQVDDSHSRKYGGSGLGLVISQRLAHAMGSEIVVNSSPGEGSEFSFELQLEVVEAGRGWQQYSTLLPEQRILIVDDNATNLKALGELLASWKVREVAQAHDGEQAVRLFRQALDNATPFDIVLLDANMPGINGHETARRIRRHAHHSRPRLVLLSSSDTPGQTGGIDIALTKPVRQSDLYNALLSLLEIQSAPASKQGGQDSASADMDFSGYRLLLVEDNHVNQLVARGMLSKTGCDIEIRENGADAVSAVQSKLYDLVLMDVQMPIMDGLQATREIRRLGGVYSELPIIAMTANVLESDARNCLAAGMDAHIGKPINKQELLSCMARFLTRAAAGLAREDGVATGQPDLGGLPGIDVAEGIKHMRGDAEAYRKVLHSFWQRYRDSDEQLRASIEGDDWPAARHLARTLRGAAQNVAAGELAQAAQRVFDACTTQDSIGAGDALRRLQRTLDVIMQGLEHLDA
jgi:two-component system sensor histidine kinase/response regulator